MPVSDYQLIILLSKICVLLALAWSLRFAVGNRNPKAVVLIWRTQFMAVALVGLGLFVPPLWNLRFSQDDGSPAKDSIVSHEESGKSIASASPTILRLPSNDNSQAPRLPMNAAIQEVVPNDRQTDSDFQTLKVGFVESPREKREAQIQQSQDAIGPIVLPSNGELQSESDAIDLAIPKTIQTSESVSSDHARTLSDVLVWLWLAGVGLGLSRMVAMFAWMRNLDRNARPVSKESLSLPSWYCNFVNPNRIRIKESESVFSPCLIGVFQPTILLPRELLQQSNGCSSVHAAIAHELMHVKGFDMAWHILLQVQQTILWPLPLVWWVSRSHSFACERVCDESASALTKNRERYRSDLAKLALTVLNSRHQTFLLSMAKQPEITRRLSLLALRPPILRISLSLKAVFLATILLGVLLGVTGSSEFSVDASSSITSDTAIEPSDSTVVASTTSLHDLPEMAVVAANTNGRTDEPNDNESDLSPIAVASTTTDNASAVQSKAVVSQKFTVHSELNPVPKKRINPRSGEQRAAHSWTCYRHRWNAN